jgi:hypothetical protein
MSERLPYEQHLHQQWTEVPLPDEDMAWADMKRRLEKDDDDGFIFWWRPGCGIIGLLLVLLGLGWWMLRESKEEKEKKEMKEMTERIDSDSVNKKRRNDNVDTSLLNSNESGSKVNENGQQQENRRPRPKNYSPVADEQKLKRPVDIKKEDNLVAKKPVSNESTTIPGNSTVENETPKADTIVSAPKKIDSLKKPATDSPAVKKTNPVDSSRQRSFFFSAGLSIQQQLPIGGQKATPYNSLGRKGSLLDYIPSVYVRLNRKDKWFIQAEFKYGAPQYTKEFLYHQEVAPDTIGGPPRFETTTSNRLKKSFYHQLPFTFNYFVKPNWSVGGGLQWNKFYGAVSDREVIKHDVVTNQDQVLSKGIVVTKSDSSGSFEKSYVQGIFETQYRWKRFSFGARYTFGLQPYITITLPNQPEKKEKNSNILIFVRYELWRQK